MNKLKEEKVDKKSEKPKRTSLENVILDKDEYSLMLRNTIINEVLYDQIQETFPELLGEEKRDFTDEELNQIFHYIAMKSKTSPKCKALSDKITNQYFSVLDKFFKAIDVHNKGVIKRQNQRMSTVLARQSEQVVSNLNRAMLIYDEVSMMEENVQRMLGRSKKRL